MEPEYARVWEDRADRLKGFSTNCVTFDIHVIAESTEAYYTLTTGLVSL